MNELGGALHSHSRANPWHRRADVPRRMPAPPVPLVVFLLVATLQGLAFIHLYGPLTIPDPDLDVPGAYALATGQSLNPTVGKGDGRRMTVTGDKRYLQPPVAGGRLIEHLDIMSMRRDPERGAQMAALNGPPRTATVAVRSNQYPPLAYAVPAIGLSLGMHLHLEPARALQLARFGSLLLFMTLIGAGIVIAPAGRWVLAAAGCLPLSVFVGASLAMDGPLIALSVLFVACSLRLMQARAPVSNMALAALAALAIALSLVKYAYAPIALLPLAAHAPTRRQKIAYLGALAALVLPVVALWQHGYAFVPYLNRTAMEGNISLLFHRPLWSMAALALNMGPATLRLIVGDQTSLAALVVMALAMLGTRSRLKAPCGASAALAAALCLLLCWLSLFLTWTDFSDPATGMAIAGFQMRYLYPLLPLLAFIPGRAERA